ncbi:tRNA (N6-threonylcarbamoyladenosine(37)-N6)-methyltransferase TrmO [Enterovirga aerilata]|uniref:tRNA (N6-threonylcarbamoyladenosine(37)-N6)-methyltransferase TrmO n=1 Tax=Enterovirga aerilata TaxID=2730920 RepID=A0A849IEU3_9HYPH|nr:tRNA (N6-threonylcarbamoyladenosine(37)-N6)-methyltransferase TrmO [Enterovirga sp. DB1703]NNM72393.1 tRNA (N6-threonylcarbamoyladenosine(37)-N6)-methyltransferase TrmO [Enterovirga sp. DB1703]
MRDELRPGERPLALPSGFDAGLYFIGRIRTPWRDRSECPKNARGSDAVCTVEVEPRYAEALTGVEAASHLILLYWMDRARRDLAIQVPRHHERPRGTFSVRSPVRPNPVALSVVQLIGRDGTSLKVVGLDCLDGTPLLDIKPYLPSVDSRPEAMMAPPAL